MHWLSIKLFTINTIHKTEYFGLGLPNILNSFLEMSPVSLSYSPEEQCGSLSLAPGLGHVIHI